MSLMTKKKDTDRKINYEDSTLKELVELCIVILGEKGLKYPAELAKRSRLTEKNNLRATIINILTE